MADTHPHTARRSIRNGLIRRIRGVLQRILGCYWKIRFQGQAWLSPGSLVLGRRVGFNHPVKFQGDGRAVIAEGVGFGLQLANDGLPPILIQPRTPQAKISIGAGTYIMNGTELIAQHSITIGKDCRIGPRTWIADSDFHGIAPEERSQRGAIAPVVLGNNVWIGTGAILLKGVTVGNDAIIGAGAVVTRSVPDGGIAVGNPARVVGSAYRVKATSE
ncbi:MAG TPA: acyltransferase [Armatimonadota bacterium]|nr:acyltransferase [Armatimonadota bacterium]